MRPRLTSAQRLERHKQRIAARKEARRLPAVLRPAGVAPEAYIGIGVDEAGQVVTLPISALLRHLHVMATTGSGKTNAILAIAMQLIAHGASVILLDPNGLKRGSPYRELLARLEHDGTAEPMARAGRLHIVDPNVITHTTNLNICHRDGETVAISVQADSILASFSATRGDEDTLSKPTTRRTLKGLFHVTIEAGLTLIEAERLLDPDDGAELRAHLLSVITDPFGRSFLRRLQRLASDPRLRREYEAETIAALNRVAEFLANPSLRRAFGLTTRPLSILQLMDTPGSLLLCNLEDGLQASAANTDLVGRLILNACTLVMKRRTTTHPVFILLEEGHRFVGKDADDLLTMARGYHCGIAIIHQNASQLIDRGDDHLLMAVKTKTGTKIRLRVEDMGEAIAVAKDIIPLDLERPVRALIRPTAIAQEIVRFRSESTARHEAETIAAAISEALSDMEAESFGTATGEMSALGSGMATGAHAGTAMTTGGDNYFFGFMPLGLLNTPNSVALQSGTSNARNSFNSTGTSKASMQSVSRGITRSIAESISKALTSGKSVAAGFSEGLRNVMKDLPQAVHSLDNVAYLAARELKELPTGVAFVTHGSLFAKVRLPLVPLLPNSDELLARARDRVFSLSYAAVGAEQADQDIARRERELRHVSLTGTAALNGFDTPEPIPHEPDRERVDGVIARATAAAAIEERAPLGTPVPLPRRPRSPRVVVDNRGDAGQGAVE